MQNRGEAKIQRKFLEAPEEADVSSNETSHHNGKLCGQKPRAPSFALVSPCLARFLWIVLARAFVHGPRSDTPGSALCPCEAGGFPLLAGGLLFDCDALGKESPPLSPELADS